MTPRLFFLEGEQSWEIPPLTLSLPFTFKFSTYDVLGAYIPSNLLYKQGLKLRFEEMRESWTNRARCIFHA